MPPTRLALLLLIPLIPLDAAPPCPWSPDPPQGPLDVTFYIVTDIEIGRGRPYSENIRYQQEIIDFIAQDHVWPAGFRGAGEPMDPPHGIVTTGDNIFGAEAGNPFRPLSLRLEYEWLWNPERLFPPFRAVIEPEILHVPAITEAIYPGFGNHDWDDGALENGQAVLLQHTSEKLPGCRGVSNFHPSSGNYSWNWGRLHLVQLNEWAGKQDPAGLDWLREDLERVGPGAPVVLFQHYGFDSFSRQSNWWTASDRTAFLDVVCDYNILGLFTGHTHHAFPASSVACPAGRRVAQIPNLIGEDGITFNTSGFNRYFGDSPQGTGTFMVVRVVEDGTEAGSFFDVATYSWARDAESGLELRTARNGLDFIQSFPVDPEPADSARELGPGSWRDLGGGALPFAPAAVALPDGAQALFAVRPDRNVAMRVVDAAGEVGSWVDLGGPSEGEPRAARGPDGRITVLRQGFFGEILARRQTAGDAFAAWTRVGGPFDLFPQTPRVVAGASGLALFAVDAGGRLRTARETAPGSFGPWTTLGGPVLGAGLAGLPAAVQSADGRWGVFARAIDQRLYARRESAPGVWNNWTQISAQTVATDPEAVRAGGEVHLLAVDSTTGRLYAATLPFDGAPAKEGLVGDLALVHEAPGAVVTPAGELRAVAKGLDSQLYTARRKPGEAWTHWDRLPRRAVYFRPFTLDLGDGRLAVAARDFDDGDLIFLRDRAPHE